MNDYAAYHSHIPAARVYVAVSQNDLSTVLRGIPRLPEDPADVGTFPYVESRISEAQVHGTRCGQVSGRSTQASRVNGHGDYMADFTGTRTQHRVASVGQAGWKGWHFECVCLLMRCMWRLWSHTSQPAR